LRSLTVIFILLILLIQYPLWAGRGGWYNVIQLTSKYEVQKKINDELKKQNNALRAEVNDLKKGTDAIEERAREELGMIKKGETYFQVINKAKQ
jgi:cell division protein FtsB|tara:strand:+ start:215 stop:496 length:282 start_codon:yes stop_codon:yes gene_type:complete